MAAAKKKKAARGKASKNRGPGRPPTYQPSFAEGVIEFMRSGASLSAYAGHLGVARQTLDNWRANYPEFREACEAGKAVRTLKLEMDLLRSDNSAVISARRFALLNAAPEEWRDQRDINLGGQANGAPVRTEAKIEATISPADAYRELMRQGK